MIALRTVAPVSLPIGAALIATACSLRSVRLAQPARNGTADAHKSVPAKILRMTAPSPVGHESGFSQESRRRLPAGIGRRERLGLIQEDDVLAGGIVQERKTGAGGLEPPTSRLTAGRSAS